MAQIQAAGARFSDASLQEYAEDEILGLCSIEIKKLPETREWTEVIDLDGNPQRYLQTQQHHVVLIQYNNPELEFVRVLELGGVIVN
jgi:hypothetical protein